MNEIWIFLIAIIVVIMVTMVEARHDYWVIRSIKGNILPYNFPVLDENRWKFWGNLYELTWFVFISAIASYFLNKWSPFLWILILWLIRWIIHDCFLGKFLADDWFHLGNTGFDGKMKEIFQNGFLYLVWKVVILIIATGSYLSIK